MAEKLLPVFVKWPYQFAVGDSVVSARFGNASKFEVTDVLHRRTGDIVYVLSSGHGTMHLAPEEELSFK
jgi:hypothetical protein